MRLTLQCEIAAPIERVFACLSDDDLRRVWTPGLEDISYPGGSRPADPVGARFIQRVNEAGHLQDYQGQITLWEPPRQLGMNLGTEGYSFAILWDLRPVGIHTHLSYQADLRHAGWFQSLLGKLMLPLTRRLMQGQLAQLKILAESVRD